MGSRDLTRNWMFGTKRSLTSWTIFTFSFGPQESVAVGSSWAGCTDAEIVDSVFNTMKSPRTQQLRLYLRRYYHHRQVTGGAFSVFSKIKKNVKKNVWYKQKVKGHGHSLPICLKYRGQYIPRYLKFKHFTLHSRNTVKQVSKTMAYTGLTWPLTYVKNDKDRLLIKSCQCTV